MTYLFSKLLFVLVFLTLTFNIFSPAFAQQKTVTDIYGREIKDSNGKRINYSKSETKNLKPIYPNKEQVSKINAKNNSKTVSNKDTIVFNTQNLFSVMGTSIGRNSMHSLDIDKDGVVDLICTGATNTFGYGHFWYILNYNSSDNTYHQVWTSSEYENNISVLEVVDFNDDGNFSIILGLENGEIQIYDAISKNLIKKAHPTSEEINSIIYADADNDSEKEIVLACDNKSYILNSSSLNQEYTIDDGAVKIRVGNVDDNELKEIVLSSGNIYLLNNNSLTTVWNYTDETYGIIELSDIDNDTKQEIILAEAWYYIKVFDVETKSIKYTINTDIDIDALLLSDVDNNGTDEILYGDGQWGSVHCYNSVTQEEMWSVDNPEHGVSAINFADLDDDGNKELIWGAGWTSSGEDYLYIYDVGGNSLKWQSADVVGPFYAIATGDADGDSQEDIVAISYESESGYGSGIILLIDPLTKQIKWQTDGDFLASVWTGIYDVAIHDIDKDGQNEIIIAAGRTYTGKIWIIDGKTHTIESSYLFSTEGLDEFYSLSIEDIGQDGTNEIIASTKDGVYVINPTNWSIKWSVSITSYNNKPITRCADVNGNGYKEIILCNGNLNIINTEDHSLWQSTETNYTNIDTVDYNQDGTTDIVASTSNGEIIIIDGNTKEELLQITPENSPIVSVRTLFIGDKLMFIYSNDGRINYYINDNNRTVSQYFAINTGEIEGLKFLNNSNEFNDIVIGTSTSVIKIPGNSINCASMNIEIEKDEVSCDIDDGKIRLNVSGGESPYNYLWNDNSTADSLYNLEPGNYSVQVQDINGCIKKKYIELTRAYIDVDVKIIDEGCIDKGSAHLNINHISPPYNIEWSNSCTEIDNINLSAGVYSVEIIDTKNCTFEKSIEIKKDTVIMDAYIKNTECFGGSDGSIHLYRLSGKEPLTYEWDNGNTTYNIFNLDAGIYHVTVTDSMGCEADMGLEVKQPDQITYDILTSGDIDSTQNWEGKIIIDNITGGTPPYYIYWPEYDISSNFIDVLPDGLYEFILRDANNCQVRDTAQIGLITSTITPIKENSFELYPNPAKDKIIVKPGANRHSINEVELLNISGKVIKKELCNNNKKVISLEGLNQGLYIIRIRYDDSHFYSKIIIKSDY